MQMLYVVLILFFQKKNNRVVLKHLTCTYYICIAFLLMLLPLNVFSQENTKEGSVPLALYRLDGRMRVIPDSVVDDTLLQ